MSLWSESKISSLPLWFHLEKQGSKAGYAVGRGNRILKFTVRSNQVSLPIGNGQNVKTWDFKTVAHQPN